jgi:type III pantothenate kinase
MTTLLIDIGNTRIKWYFDTLDQPLTADTTPLALNHHTQHWLGDLQSAWAKTRFVTKCYISNVAHIDVLHQVYDVISRTFPDCLTQTLMAQKQHRTLHLAYDNPSQMGADRYAQLLGAQSLGTDKNRLVISAGTATTIDGVLAGGQHIGGLILPSVDLMRKSLHEYTAKLPLDGGQVTISHAPSNTNDALATAAHLATIGAVYEFASRYMPHEDFEIILWGGRADSLAEDLSHARSVKVVPSLCLLGLKHAQFYS